MERVRAHNKLSRREFIKGVAATTGSLFLPTCTRPKNETKTTREPTPPPTETPNPTSKLSPEEPIFAAEPSFEVDFSQLETGPINPNDWTLWPETGYNGEVQVYTYREKNIRIRELNGSNVLVIQARKETYGSGEEQRGYTSSQITTEGNLDFRHGRLEVTARLPVGAGTFPALWLLSSTRTRTQNATDKDWQDEAYYARNGEIDIMEAQGAQPGMIFATTHSYNSVSLEEHNGGEIEVDNPYTIFHTYTLEWQSGQLVFLVDDQEFYRREKQPGDNLDSWPFDGENYHLIINLAMGGTWAKDLAEEQSLGHIIDDSRESEWQFVISAIRYYPLMEK